MNINLNDPDNNTLRNAKSYVGSIDQGTSSTRFILYDEKGNTIVKKQEEFDTKFPKPGWAEQDPFLILQTVHNCIDRALKESKVDVSQIKGIGITNQRETTIVWDKNTGKPLYDALVWLDTRTSMICDNLIAKYGSKEKFRSICGLPISTYFSATKLMWLIQNVPEVSKAVQEKRCLFGTVDSWLIYNLTEKPHLTDVTNASRTMLMDLKTCQWDKSTCDAFDIPMHVLPTIKSSAEIYGIVKDGPLKGVPISGVLGDQQAALVGQGCFEMGSAKNTYGTGCFMLFNTGTQAVASTHGLLTTVGFQLGKDQPVIYALEGSIAIAGAGVKWLRDNLGIISTPSDMDKYGNQVPDTSGVYFVPAFNGLFAPYWRDDARGAIVGLSQYSNKNHIIRALLEATAFQTKEILNAMEKDSGVVLKKLKVDGGMTDSSLLLQIQSDLLGIPVVKPTENSEATAFGAAFAAGLATGIFQLEEFSSRTDVGTCFESKIDSSEREQRSKMWKKAVERSFDWV